MVSENPEKCGPEKNEKKRFFHFFYTKPITIVRNIPIGISCPHETGYVMEVIHEGHKLFQCVLDCLVFLTLITTAVRGAWPMGGLADVLF